MITLRGYKLSFPGTSAEQGTVSGREERHCDCEERFYNAPPQHLPEDLKPQSLICFSANFTGYGFGAGSGGRATEAVEGGGPVLL